MATLAPSLQRQWQEVNERWPDRDHWSDGWLGDDSHATRFSDHNPDEEGWVHATDTDATIEHKMGSGKVGDEVCAALLRLARSGKQHPINYIIYKGIIYSRSYGFTARAYTGTNAHYSHVHCSIVRTDWARYWDGSWGIIIEKEWDELATRADIKAAVEEVVDAKVSADNPSFMNALHVAIDNKAADLAAATWDHEYTHPNGTKARMKVWVAYCNTKVDEVKSLVSLIREKVGA